MKKILSLALLTLPFVGHAQFGNLLQKAKNKVAQRVDTKVDKGMDKTLNGIEGAASGKSASPENGDGNNSSGSGTGSDKTAGEAVKSYSKFDFIPGEKIIYAEDFSQDAIGELPLTWNASGKGEVQTLQNKPGKWLRLFENNTYLTGNKKSFGENYTIEFDLMYYFNPKEKGYVLPSWELGLFSSGKDDPADNMFLRDQGQHTCTDVAFSFGSYGNARMNSSLHGKGSTFLSDVVALGDVSAAMNKITHYSLQVQKTRFRLWINDKKVFDVPRAVNTEHLMNQLFFKLESSNYKEEEVGLFLSNLKIATGLPDTRHKLVDEGKFATTGILFDPNEATIKPESNGVLKEIAEVLKSNEGMKVTIIGHTDSDGSDAANLELSKKRAEAVKAALVKDWGVPETPIRAEGRGESVPVADNKTKEGKVQNRRVEFVKN